MLCFAFGLASAVKTLSFEKARLHRVVRAGIESLNNCTFFYIIVRAKNIVGWE